MTMNKNSGYLCEIDTGGKAVVPHNKQEQAFKDVGKSFIRYLNDDFTDVYVDGKPKTGLIDTNRLKVIGYYD